jgi:hypothetical protein
MTLDRGIKTIVIELLKLSRSPDGLRNQAIALIDLENGVLSVIAMFRHLRTFSQSCSFV